MRRAGRTALIVALAASPVSASEPWAIPAEGSCVPAAGVSMQDARDDLVPGPPLPGEVITLENAARLAGFLPPELWEHRERFFYDGMHMEIGPCFRDYGPPAFYREATERGAGRAVLTKEGRLEGHGAGLPFPADTILPDDPRAGLRWAWNWAFAYQGAGSFRSYRLSIVNQSGTAESWEGDAFYALLAGRADRAADGYRGTARSKAAWAAGGVSKNMKTGGRGTFRQYATGRRRPDYFVAGGGMRRLLRSVPPDAEAALTAVLVEASIGGGLFTHGEVPHLHEWKIHAVTDLLAPINTHRDTYPVDGTRNFGPWGISFASDRWELRRVLVLDGSLKQGQFEDGATRYRWYLDLQTLAPLYYAAYRESGEVAGVGYFVMRWSEDREAYPRWPDDAERPVRVLDVVGEAWVDWNDQHAVRVELGDTVSVPPPDKKLDRMISLSSVRVR